MTDEMLLVTVNAVLFLLVYYIGYFMGRKSK